jgi:dimethylhistidine N-methyltransferase
MTRDRRSETMTDAEVDLAYDLGPDHSSFLEDVLSGLSRPRKEIPSKYLYDERGSQLFDAICELEEYYPTRTEIKIMNQNAPEMADLIGPRVLLIEYGSGSSTKTPILLKRLHRPAGYVPIDISRHHLLSSARRLKDLFPDLKILPVCADYTVPFDLPKIDEPVNRRVVYYPGSTIGNFHPWEAADFLRQIAEVCGGGGGLLLGVDLQKSRDILIPAYNDGAGVTAAFNLNLLERINRELGADFDVEQFEHRAIYNEEHARIEMHLISTKRQTVSIGDRKFALEAGESILTEYSYKYGIEGFAELAGSAGFNIEQVWTDEEQLFSVQYLTVA